MQICLVTGAGGLVGSEACERFVGEGYEVVGVDNDSRKAFFGPDASVDWRLQQLSEKLGEKFRLVRKDISDRDSVENIFSEYGADIGLIIHCAAQPSHDWAVTNPFLDFEVNANGTHNLLENFREYCPASTFIHMSTNKVYGDLPNELPLVERETRWELSPTHKFYDCGVDESMSIDQSTHSLFGVSKTAADLLVQEYGRYFGLNTIVLRGGCLTGPSHSGTQLHGFLSYLCKCAITKQPYTIFGYGGKQVRDNIHSSDLIAMMIEIAKAPRSAMVYNVGGGRYSNCSVLEAIRLIEDVSGAKVKYEIVSENRVGDHLWWISDLSKFKAHYPTWRQKFDARGLIEDICSGLTERTL